MTISNISIKMWGATVLLFGLLSCTGDFEALNTNPNQPSSVEPAPLFTAMQLRVSGVGSTRRGSIGFGMMMTQQTATLKIDDLEGDKYLRSESASVLFSESYRVNVVNLTTLLHLVKDDPEQVNLYAAARILWVMQMHKLTDAYGDIPYSEAGKGFLEQIYAPKYDAQAAIYADMLRQLDEAVNSFDASKATFGAADLYYGGDIDKWKKLGNSLMLRLGLRLVKVDPASAETWVSKAVSKGVMTNENDICFVKHEGSIEETANPTAFDFLKFDLVRVGDIKMSQRFVDYLQNSNDPRLAAYSSLPNGDNAPKNQKGLPNGYDATTIEGYPGGADLDTYSTFNTRTFLALDAANVQFSYAEVELMLAEAATRGWIDGSAADHYRKGVTASMNQQQLFGYTISPQQTEAYLATGKPFDGSASVAEQLKVINEQYWVTTFLNGWESYANWRRTGIPELTPVNYPGNVTNGTIPRRLTYPRTEYGTNGEHLQEAISRQGENNYTTRVWWDAE